MRLVLAFATALSTSPLFAAPSDGRCHFEGAALVCDRGDGPIAALHRFASPQTADLMRERSKRFWTVENRGERERYRRSVEQQNRRSFQLARLADRDLRDGRITPAEHAEIAALNRAALVNYRLGLRLYHRAYWFDEDEPRDLGPNEPVPLS